MGYLFALESTAMRLLPRQAQFFEMFAAQAEAIQESARMLLEMMQKCDDLDNRADRIKAVEHRGDTITHDIMTKLNQTFITPIDREDIHALSSSLDDVLDFIDEAASRMMLFKLTKPWPPAIELSKIAVRCADEIVTAVGALEKKDNVLRHCIELNRLENEADHVGRMALAQLFEQEHDPIVIIKLKEIYEDLEAAIDRCEDVANVLENVVVKSA